MSKSERVNYSSLNYSYLNKRALEQLISYIEEVEGIWMVFSEESAIRVKNRLEVLRENCFGHQTSTESPRDIGRKIMEASLSFGDIPVNLVKDISQEEIDFFEDYYYANYLLIKCKESAISLSPGIWKGIEDQMLKVPEYYWRMKRRNEE